MSKLLYNSNGANTPGYGVWFSPDNSKIFVLNKTIARVVDVETGSNIKVFDLYDMIDKGKICNGNFDDWDPRYLSRMEQNSNIYETGDYQNGLWVTGTYRTNKDSSDIYIFTNNYYHKFSFEDNSFQTIANFREHLSRLSNTGTAEVIPNKDMSKILISGNDRNSDQDATFGILDLENNTELVQVTELEHSDWNVFSAVEFIDNQNKVLCLYKRNDKTQIRIYTYTEGSNGFNHSDNCQLHSDEVMFIKQIDDDLILSGDASGKVIKWKLSTKEVIEQYDMHGAPGTLDFQYFDYPTTEHSVTENSLTNSGDDLTFTIPDKPLKEGTVTAYEDGTDITSDISNIDLDNGEVTFASTHTGTVTADYTWIETLKPRKVISGGSGVKVYDEKERTIFAEFDVDGWVDMINVSPNGKYIAAISHNEEVVVYDLDLHIVTNRAKKVQYNSMELHGELYDMNGYSSLDCYFEYSPDPNFNVGVKQSSVVTMTEPGEFSVEVTNIDADTKYYYRALATETTT